MKERSAFTRSRLGNYEKISALFKEELNVKPGSNRGVTKAACRCQTSFSSIHEEVETGGDGLEYWKELVDAGSVFQDSDRKTTAEISGALADLALEHSDEFGFPNSDLV